MSDLSVIVSTRFGVGVTDKRWLEHRFALFESITAPSLKSQTFQGFIWNIFVGEQAESWVVDKLRSITAGIGCRVLIHKAPQGHDQLRKCSEEEGARFCLLCLIDDDDAWHIDCLSWAFSRATQFIADGQDRVAFTFSEGYEWLVTDLVDIDALHGKNKKIVRSQAAYAYSRPFLTMGSFILSPSGNIPWKFARTHSTFGECLIEDGYTIHQEKNSTPAWIYVRHRHADSAIRKAHDSAPINIDLAILARDFGIDSELVRHYQRSAAEYGYAAKRSHKVSDKSSLIFDVHVTNDFKLEQRMNKLGLSGVAVSSGGYYFKFFNGMSVFDVQLRIVGFDKVSSSYVYKGVIEPGAEVYLPYSVLGKMSGLKFKIQKFDEEVSAWVDVTPYVNALENS